MARQRATASILGGLLSLAAAALAVAAPAHEQCLLCHGAEAQGNQAIGAPALSMLPSWYLAQQLRAYRSGDRGAGDEYGAAMQAVAAVLTDEQIETLAYVVATLPFESPAPLPTALAVAGQYQACAGCHGEAAEGNATLLAPPLAGQNAWYLRKRMEQFLALERAEAGADSSLLAMQASLSAIGADGEALVQLSEHLAAMAPTNDQSTGQQEFASMKTRRDGSTALMASALLAATPLAAADNVVRYPLPNGSTFPIALAVETSPGTTLIHHSGLTPRPIDPEAERFSEAYWGDTKTQALSVFGRMESSLEALGVGFGDIIKMTVFLVGTEATGGRLDFAGFMEAYTQYFGTEAQPNLPARSAVQVAGLAAPGMLVEVEVIIARPGE